MRTLSLLALTSLVSTAILAQAPPPVAPAAPAAPPAAAAPLNLQEEVEGLYKDAADAFNQGKFDVALQKLAALHTKTENKDYEQVMFLEGAAHYNLEQYDKAIELLQKFVTTFPQSDVLNDAKMSLGRAHLKKDNEDAGVKILKEVAAVPALRDQAGLEIAYYYKKKQKPDEALAILQVILTGLTGTPSVEQTEGILMAAEIHVNKGESEKAASLMDKLRAGSSAEDSIVQLNNLGVKVGDSMLEQNRYGEALRAYQNVRRQSEVIRIQKARVAKYESWVARITAGQKVYFMGKSMSKEDAQGMLDANKGVLGELEKAKDYDASIFYRLGQCFYEMGRYYESMIAFQKVYDDFKDFPDRSRALFGMIVTNAQLKRTSRAYDYCGKYVDEFPEGANIAQVTDMLASLAYEGGKVEEAVRIIKMAITKPGADKARLSFLLGSILFESQQFDEARLAFQGLIMEDPKTAYLDDAEYRIALTYFFTNDSKETRRKLRDYIAKHIKDGQYIVDAKYRLAFIDSQAGERENAKEELLKLINDYPNDQNIGQVYSLLGDIYSAYPPESDPKTDFTQLALEAYRAGVDKAKTEDVLNYVIEAATNLMVDRGQWKEVSEMWSKYYEDRKTSPSALKAIYWITRAKERASAALRAEGKTEEADKTAREAQTLVAQAMLPHIGNPANEQVEVLIQQLVTMMVPKKRARAATVQKAEAPATPPAGGAAPAGDKPADAAAPAAPTPPPAPVITFEEVEEQFKKLMMPEGEASLVNGTAAARILYGRAMIARLMRDVPKFDNLIGIIPDAAKAEELSPLLLATLADMLLKKGDSDKAGEYYNMLRSKYPNSEFADKAPVGLGNIEFQKKEYQKALELYNEAIEKYAASSSILDATLGKAKALFQLRKYDEAEKLYKVIFSTREWRGEAHAESLFMMGQIAEARKDWAKAVSDYQRVYVSQAKYKAWMAKAYLQAAKASMELNKKDDAVKLLREMLLRKDITDQPAFIEAQQYLGKIGG